MKTKDWKISVELELTTQEIMELATICSHGMKAKDLVTRVLSADYHKRLQALSAEVSDIPMHYRYPGTPAASS